MLFGLELEEVIRAIGVLGIAAIVFAESGLLIGFFLPGDTLLFTAGFLAHDGIIGVNIHLMVAILFVAAVLGDNVGYWFGKKAGPRIFKREDSILFHKENLQRAEKFYEKWGPITLVIARFTPVVRTFAPIVAGVGKMDYKRFMFYNLFGGLLWTTSITYLGYYGGAFLEANGIDVEALVVPVILFAVLLSVASPLIHIIKDPKSRNMVLRRLGIKKNDKA
jgi:membrane-associated protein